MFPHQQIMKNAHPHLHFSGAIGAKNEKGKNDPGNALGLFSFRHSYNGVIRPPCGIVLFPALFSFSQPPPVA